MLGVPVILSREPMGGERTAGIGVAPDIQHPGFRACRMSADGRSLPVNAPVFASPDRPLHALSYSVKLKLWHLPA